MNNMVLTSYSINANFVSALSKIATKETKEPASRSDFRMQR